MARKRSRPAPVFDPAVSDPALAAARQDFLVGRWQAARDVLRGSFGNWDLRTHRVLVLASAAVERRVVESWQAAEPNNPDALVLRAQTEVARAFAVVAAGAAPPPQQDALERSVLDRVGQVCWHAAEANPADPVPWVSLLTLARLYGGGHSHVWEWWQELQRRDPWNREGYHQAMRHLSARWHGSHADMYNFARETAAIAPPGSPLPVLPQAARVEHYRHLLSTQDRTSMVVAFHWNNDAACSDLRTTLRLWLPHREPPGAAQDVADLNLLAHGLVHAGMLRDAAEVFRLLDNKAAHAPWAYTGDPAEQFIRWRDQLLG